MMSSLALSKNNHSCVSNESLVTTERDINKAAYGIETGSTILLFSHGYKIGGWLELGSERKWLPLNSQRLVWCYHTSTALPLGSRKHIGCTKYLVFLCSFG
ncbi:hypothetical protein ACHAW5_010405 [Stephanodiscus triporus]|uniref:Uncharacterized protein n=1 Tax=Stephanodiscus triporus TaxID=2934178 RepID=A0ABD3PVW4_9STRA